MTENSKPKIRLDLPRLWQIVRQDKKAVLLWCGVAAVVSIVVAFSIPRIYKASIVLAPEETSNGFSGSISSLASMVGMSMRLGQNGDAIYPEIYPDAMESTDFLVSLFPVKVTSKDGKISNMDYSEYLQKHQKSPWWTLPASLLHALVEKLQEADAQPTDSSGRPLPPDPFQLTRKQYGLARSISGNISCAVDKKTNVITITVTDQDPLIAATMANVVTEKLQTFITDYRTNKARNDEAYMKQLLKEAEKEYNQARHDYAAYCDAYNEAYLQSVKSKMDALENDMQLKFTIYTQVVEQLQLARARVQERMPAFTVLQNAFVPVKHSNTPKLFILAAFVMLAFAARLALLLWRHAREFYY